MRQVTLDLAIKAIEKRFCGLAEIMNVEDSETLNIYCVDVLSGDWYEVFSNEERTSLKISKILLNENK